MCKELGLSTLNHMHPYPILLCFPLHTHTFILSDSSSPPICPSFSTSVLRLLPFSVIPLLLLSVQIYPLLHVSFPCTQFRSRSSSPPLPSTTHFLPTSALLASPPSLHSIVVPSSVVGGFATLDALAQSTELFSEEASIPVPYKGVLGCKDRQISILAYYINDYHHNHHHHQWQIQTFG